MRPDAAMQIFEEAGAIRHGHFELTSGLHSGTYVQCALVLQYPKYAEQLGRALAAEFMDLRVDCVASGDWLANPTGVGRQKVCNNADDRPSEEPSASKAPPRSTPPAPSIPLPEW